MSTENHDPEIGPDGWDKEAIYDSEIAPLMSQIIEICKRENIPMLASFEYRHSDDTGDGESRYCTTHLPGPGEYINEKFHGLVRSLRSSPSFLALTVTRSES